VLKYNQLPRAEERLEAWLDLRVEIFEPLAAMSDHGRAQRAKRFLAHLDRTWNVQLHVCHKRTANIEKETRKARGDLYGQGATVHHSMELVCPCLSEEESEGAVWIREKWEVFVGKRKLELCQIDSVAIRRKRLLLVN
jgi:hypothetical protein